MGICKGLFRDCLTLSEFGFRLQNWTCPTSRKPRDTGHSRGGLNFIVVRQPTDVGPPTVNQPRRNQRRKMKSAPSTALTSRAKPRDVALTAISGGPCWTRQIARSISSGSRVFESVTTIANLGEKLTYDSQIAQPSPIPMPSAQFHKPPARQIQNCHRQNPHDINKR